MKRIYFTILVLVASVIAMQANPVSQQEARKKAITFMQKNGKQINNVPARVKGIKSSVTQAPFYVFNSTGGQGFVIIAGDDNATDILGYTNQGSFDEDNLPDNFRYWMEETARQIEALGKAGNGNGITTQELVIHDAIEPLIKTQWDQGNNDGVYNAKCPTINGEHCLTGCVATAGAQILYYYGMPVTAVSVEGYQLTGAAPEVNEQTKAGTQEHEFNWGIMKLSYTSEDQGSEAAEEVATLMQYVGYAAKMGYGLDGSSASDYHLMTGLQNYFYFDTGAVYATRNEYTISKWDEMIYNELMNNRPVVYSGTDVNRSGHTFICDGYDGEGLYHFNWGWGGAYDGYYKLQATDPYKGDNNRLGGFITNQSALLGLQPPFASSGPVISGDEQGIVGTVFAHQVAADGETIIMHMGNKNSFTCAFKFGIGELKEDGTIKRLADTGGWDRLDQGYYHPNVNFYPATYKLGDGKHKLVPISLLKDESEWKRCKPLSLCFEVEYSGEKLVSLSEGTDVEMVAIPEVKEWQFADPTYAGMTSSANVTVANGGKVEYNGPLYMVISLQDDITTAQITHVAGSAIEPESRETVAFYPYFPTEGTWYVWVVTDMTDYNSSIGKTTVEVSALPNGDCNLQADTDNSTVVFNEDGTKVTVTTTIEDVAGTGYFNSLFPTLFPIIDNIIDYNNRKAQKYISNFIIQPNGKKEVTVTFEGLDKDSKYALLYLYVNNNQAANAGDILIDYQTTGISNSSVNLRNDEFFTLDGLKRIGKPKTKGIYLHHGRKVIIK